MAFATSIRSPNNCVISLIYGVSPQPEQAPENSNSGGQQLVFLMRGEIEMRGIDIRQSLEKFPVGHFLFAQWRYGAILSALRPTWLCFSPDRLPRRARIRCSLRGDLERVVLAGKLFEMRIQWPGKRLALLPAPRDHRLSRGSPRADRPYAFAALDDRSWDPTPGSPSRYCASRSGPCPTDMFHRLGSALTGS